MALSLESITTGGPLQPPIIINHGEAGVGKTVLGCRFPSPVVMQVEEGLTAVDPETGVVLSETIPHFPLIEAYEQLMEGLATLAQGGHEFKTLVIDSLDHFEPLIWKQVCADANVKSIEDIGYGKGYAHALDYWRDFSAAIKYLRRTMGMTIFLVAHSEIKRFDNPETESYDRYQIKLHKGASALMQEHADIILFTNYRTSTTKEKTGFGSETVKAKGTGERVIYTEARPGFIAKNRFSMPPDLPNPKTGAFEHLAQFIPYFKQQKMES